MVPALVLTAGLATRLRPLSLVRAKGAMPVAGTPLVRRILAWLASQGVTEAVLNLHHLPHSLTALIGDGGDLGVTVRYSWETPLLGSAGGPARALALLTRAGRTFLIVNGDTLTDMDAGALVAQHRASGALVTMAVVPNVAPDKYGGVLLDADGGVTGFSRRGSGAPSFHFIGVQAAEPEAFASVPVDVAYESVGTLYPALITMRPGSIRAFRTAAECLDIGTPGDYLATSLLLAARETGHDAATNHAEVRASARVEDSVLWDDVVVEDGARVRSCVVTDSVRIPADTSWRGMTVRVAAGMLAPGETRIGELAVASLA
jgi:NDP-sugar pyrophosphorylase family protein